MLASWGTEEILQIAKQSDLVGPCLVWRILEQYGRMHTAPVKNTRGNYKQ